MEKVLYIKITKCSNSSWWYNDKIGEIYKVVRLNGLCVGYTVYIKDGETRDILLDDCVDIDTIEQAQAPNSILLEANSIVNGERNEQYGDAKEAFSVYSDICKTAFNLDLSPDDVCKVLMAVKLGRLKYKYKRDSIVDLCGYAEILSKLKEL